MIDQLQNVAKTTPSFNPLEVPGLNRQDTLPIHIADQIRFGGNTSLIGRVFGKIGSAISYIVETIKSIFRTIFFCVSYSTKINEKLDIKGLEELRDTFTSLKKNFNTEKMKGPEALKEWWKGAFGTASKIVQQRIVCKHLEGKAIDKGGENQKPEDFEKLVGYYYNKKDVRENALRFVREMEIVRRADDNAIFEPVHFLPLYFDRILADIDVQIKQQQSAK